MIPSIRSERPDYTSEDVNSVEVPLPLRSHDKASVFSNKAQYFCQKKPSRVKARASQPFKHTQMVTLCQQKGLLPPQAEGQAPCPGRVLELRSAENLRIPSVGSCKHDLLPLRWSQHKQEEKESQRTYVYTTLLPLSQAGPPVIRYAMFGGHGKLEATRPLIASFTTVNENVAR